MTHTESARRRGQAMTDTPYLTRARQWLEPKHYRNFITNSGAWNAHAANELAALLMQVRNEALDEAARLPERWPWPEAEFEEFERCGRGGQGDYIARKIRSLKEPRQ